MSEMCQSCESAVATVIEPCDDEFDPYRVCATCHARLMARALRPLEWYNLAKRHGCHTYLLHDDFYADGQADQPLVPVESPEEFPLPRLEEVSASLDALFDYSMTQWRIEADVVDAWKRFCPQNALQLLKARYAATQNAGFRGMIVDICAHAYKEAAADFVREAWMDYPERLDLCSLAFASCGCLPDPEGYDRVIDALDALPAKDRYDLMYACLFPFRSARVLEWIERHVSLPVANSWGLLAAYSQLDGERVVRWLAQGRPLSLVALDALARCIQHEQRWEPAVLISKPDRQALHQALEACAATDPVPRVKKAVAALLEHVHELGQDAV